jgi:hypothetical protein
MPKLHGAHLLCLAAIVVAACTSTDAPAARTEVLRYEGVETRLLDDDLVNFRVQLRGDAARDEVDAYARCAAAQYALIRGFGFARHVRTNLREQGGVWIADAVYTISPALPRGVQTLDAEVVAAACAEQGIPTV